jgi:siroheme synthase
VERATWPDQRVIPTTLAGLVATAATAQLRSPTLLIVGEVAALAVWGVVDPAAPLPSEQPAGHGARAAGNGH